MSTTKLQKQCIFYTVSVPVTVKNVEFIAEDGSLKFWCEAASQ